MKLENLDDNIKNYFSLSYMKLPYFGDNTLYYLEKYGFNDTDCLEDYTLDLITEEVYKILKLWKQEN